MYRKRLTLYISLLGFSIAACSGSIPGETETPTAGITRTPNITLVPSATLTPIALPTLTSTPTPIPTNTPTATQPILVGTALPGEFQPISSWNAASVSELAEWDEDSVSDLAWTPDSQTLAVANSDYISLVDIQTRSQEEIIETADGLISIAFFPSGGLLASGINLGSEQTKFSGLIDFWDIPDLGQVELHLEDERGVSEIAFSPDSAWFAAAFTGLEPLYNCTVDFWDSSSWEITNVITTGTSLDIAFSPDGQRIATTPDRYAIKMWRVDNGILLYTKYTSFTGAVNAIVFSPDGQNLATGHYDGEIRLWNATSGELLLTIETDSVIESLAYSPDGTVIASGDGYFNHNIRLWDSATGELLQTLTGNTHAIGSLAFSPNGEILASGSYNGNVRLWGIRP